MGSNSTYSHVDVVKPLVNGCLTGKFHALVLYQHRFILDTISPSANPSWVVLFYSTCCSNWIWFVELFAKRHHSRYLSASMISGFFAAASCHPIPYTAAMLESRSSISALFTPQSGRNFLIRFQSLTGFCMEQYAIFEEIRNCISTK